MFLCNYLGCVADWCCLAAMLLCAQCSAARTRVPAEISHIIELELSSAPPPLLSFLPEGLTPFLFLQASFSSLASNSINR